MNMRILFLIVSILFLYGCATIGQPRFVVSVDSLAAPNADHKKNYVLLPGNKNVTLNDLQFKEYAQYLIRLLNLKGYRLVDKAEEADLAIVLFYGIGKPQKRYYSYTLPVWGQTGVSSSYTYGTASVYGNSASYSGTTTYTPTYGVTGYTQGVRSRITYNRYAQVIAFNFKEYRDSKKAVQVWKTTITSTGSSGDLRRVFPVLISASVPYIGSNTKQKINVKLYESDDIVKTIKGISKKKENKSEKK